MGGIGQWWEKTRAEFGNGVQNWGNTWGKRTRERGAAGGGLETLPWETLPWRKGGKEKGKEVERLRRRERERERKEHVEGEEGEREE